MTTTAPVPVTLIPGDGIGPEISDVVIRLVAAAGGTIAWEHAVAGAAAFTSGVTTGVPEETLDSIARTGLALKGPLETPIGFGGKSANVTLRKRFETFANIRPARELPGVVTPFTGRGIDLVVIRENVEDLYAGIEHMQTPDVAQCLKIVTRLGAQRIVRTALEFARAEGRRKVTVVTKANIMKLTEGLLLREFEAAAAEYPDLQTEQMLVDNCAHQLVIAPEQFDVLVMTNMNGDIISDLTSGLVGGLGFAPSANLGSGVAIFEAVHGSAPLIAGKGIANPTALLLSAAMLLRHIGQMEAASRLQDALFETLRDGIHTADVPGPSSVGTQAFADAIEARLAGQAPATAKGWAFKLPEISPSDARRGLTSREPIGLDIFVESTDSPDIVGARLSAAAEGSAYRLKMVSNRGTAVWPGAAGATSCVDHFRCRFTLLEPSGFTPRDAIDLLERVSSVYPWMHVERLEAHDGERAYTLAQGEQ